MQFPSIARYFNPLSVTALEYCQLYKVDKEKLISSEEQKSYQWGGKDGRF